MVRRDQVRVLRPDDHPSAPEGPQTTDRSGSPEAEPQSKRSFAGGVKWLGLQLARAILPLIVLAAAVAGFQYLKATKPVPPKQTPQETRFAVSVVPVSIQDVRPKITLYGTAVAAREVELRALVAGRIIDTGDGLKNGAIVERGAPLVTIDPFEFETNIRETEAQRAETLAKIEELKAQRAVEEANLKFAEEQLKLGQRDLDRAATLARRGNLTARAQDDRRLIVSQRRQTVAQGRNNLIVTDARIKQQEAALQRLDNTLGQRRQRLAETKLVAPFDGYVSEVNAQVGRMVSTNDKVAVLIDRNRMDVRFTLTDAQFGRLAGEGSVVGREVKVNWSVGGATFTYAAVIDRIAARVESSSGGVDVYARVSDPAKDVPLRAGAFVQVVFDDILYENVIGVPSSSLYDQSKVYIVEDGRLASRTVKVVGAGEAGLLVRGDLKPGDQVLKTRLSLTGDGVPVEVR
ncbi:MAG: efflux RND transporter periplasmic adaptor subunit [Pseudomonadota bacterium]